MTRRILAVAGTLALGIVALFTLFNALKAVLGLAIIAFVGRGLMRLWHSGGEAANWRGQHRFGPRHHRHHHRGLYRHDYETRSWSGIQPQHQQPREAETVVPIW